MTPPLSPRKLRRFVDPREAQLQREVTKERRYRVTLPSEAEWEKAARGGLRLPAVLFDPANPAAWSLQPETENSNPDRIYPWGDEPAPKRANYKETGTRTTSAVGCFPGGRSPYGVEEMSGNVWEWTRSLFEGYPYPQDERERKKREDTEVDGRRVLRGGSWGDNNRVVRRAFRSWNFPDDWDLSIGFRVVCLPI